MNCAHLCIFADRNRVVVRRTQCGGKSFIASSIKVGDFKEAIFITFNVRRIYKPRIVSCLISTHS